MRLEVKLMAVHGEWIRGLSLLINPANLRENRREKQAQAGCLSID